MEVLPLRAVCLKHVGTPTSSLFINRQSRRWLGHKDGRALHDNLRARATRPRKGNGRKGEFLT